MADYKRCEMCSNSRVIITENGLHSVCCLSDKNAIDCITKRKDYYVEKLKIRTPQKEG